MGIFLVLVAAGMKVTVFCVSLCSMVKVKLVPDYMIQQSRRQPPSNCKKLILADWDSLFKNFNVPVTVMKISLPPSKCNTSMSYSLSSPEFSLNADFLSTYTSSLISHFSPVNKIITNSKLSEIQKLLNKIRSGYLQTTYRVKWNPCTSYSQCNSLL